MAKRLILLFISFCFVLILSAQKDIKQFESKIDSILIDAIDSMAFPGAQIFVSHKNQVVIHKAYGHHTYAGEVPVDTSHLYDLASVTKMVAGGLALMKIQEKGLFSVSETLKETHPHISNRAKKHITWKEILAHQSGLQPYIVFWQTALNRNRDFKRRTFKPIPSQKYPIMIDDGLFLHRRYPKKMFRIINRSSVSEEKKYRYSGLAFLLIPDLVYERTGFCLDEYLQVNVFDPLSIDRIAFNPSQNFSLEQIVPTEIDTFFRKRLVHGYVHDENASMLNGVSANAGLFANASALGKIGHLLLGENEKILKSETINFYNTVQFPENDNRRGLVFDKPPLDKTEPSYIAPSASPASFGHSGFTGTFFWIDPEHDLVFVFLSNRVHPYRSQRKLYTMDIRPKIHEAAYQYIKSLKE